MSAPRVGRAGAAIATKAKRSASATTVDGYIASQPEQLRERLRVLRAHLRMLLPEAEEVIAYGIPTYKSGKALFHFAAYAGHIGLYPGPGAIAAHAGELDRFKTSKGAIQVPHSEPLPLGLVTKLARFNLATLVPPARQPALGTKRSRPA